MGKTQPSLTSVLDEELDKLQRVAVKLEDGKLAGRVRLLRKRARIVETALEGEVADPLEVLLIAALMGDRF